MPKMPVNRISVGGEPSRDYKKELMESVKDEGFKGKYMVLKGIDGRPIKVGDVVIFGFKDKVEIGKMSNEVNKVYGVNLIYKTVKCTLNTDPKTKKEWPWAVSNELVDFTSF